MPRRDRSAVAAWSHAFPPSLGPSWEELTNLHRLWSTLLALPGYTVAWLEGQPGGSLCALCGVCCAQILRPMYSNPPLHGSLLAQTILSDPQLNALWRKEVKVRP